MLLVNRSPSRATHLVFADSIEQISSALACPIRSPWSLGRRIDPALLWPEPGDLVVGVGCPVHSKSQFYNNTTRR